MTVDSMFNELGDGEVVGEASEVIGGLVFLR